MSSGLIFESAAEPVREGLLHRATVNAVGLVVVDEEPQVLALRVLPVNSADLPYSDLATDTLHRKTQRICSLVRIKGRKLAAASLHEEPDRPQRFDVFRSTIRRLPLPF